MNSAFGNVQELFDKKLSDIEAEKKQKLKQIACKDTVIDMYNRDIRWYEMMKKRALESLVCIDRLEMEYDVDALEQTPKEILDEIPNT